MSGKSTPTVLGALPNSRPHRRSARRAPATAPSPPAGEPTPAAAPPPAPAESAPADPGPGPVTLTVQAATELAELSLTTGVRLLRDALSLLPRP